jgi:hypothetical protein
MTEMRSNQALDAGLLCEPSQFGRTRMGGGRDAGHNLTGRLRLSHPKQRLLMDDVTLAVGHDYPLLRGRISVL